MLNRVINMRKRKRKKGFRLRHLIMILIVFWLGKNLISQSMMMRDLNKRKAKEEQEIMRLEEEINQLEAEIENKDSLNFVEKVARDELKLVKPREIMYIDRNKENNIFVRPIR